MNIEERIGVNIMLACVACSKKKRYRDAKPAMVFIDEKDTMGCDSNTHRHTFIMRWNPEISCHKIANFEDGMTGFHNEGFYYDWSIFDYENAKVGDLFYMIRVGEGRTGIVMRGTIISEPYIDDDWSGMGRTVHYVRLQPECMIHPEKAKTILTMQELEQAIPEVNWNEGHSGVLVNDILAKKLDGLWEQYLEKITQE